MKREWLRSAVAVMLAMGLAVFIVYMVIAAGSSDETEWTRLVYVFSAAEAVGFAAVGWLFGREVHRVRAENAEQEASTAREQTVAANEATAQASQVAAEMRTKGYALAEVVRATGESSGAYDDEEGLLAGDFAANGSAARQLADRLFPPEQV